MSEFSGYWALILGGSSGLGYASALKLASHGMNICIVHRDRKSEMDRVNSEFDAIKSYGVELITFNKDVLQNEAVIDVLSAIPNEKIKLLLHSIAKGSVKPLVAKDDSILSKEDLDITIHAMGTSWYTWVQALLKNEKFSRGARSIAFTSEGNSKVWRGYAAVSAAKATLEALMRSMAVEFAPLRITTNCIQAGVTPTPSFKMIPESEVLAKFTKNRNPFKRLTTPTDVANVVYLLCKKEADWINGTIVKVDGGESNQ